MLNIVIPMAGHGRRFKEAGYAEPKPLIPVHGRPMIELVVENVRPRRAHRFVFICRQEHIDTYGLAERLGFIAPGAVVLGIDEVTEGAACTVLKAAPLIDSDEPLMIANSDQWVDASIDEYLSLQDGDGLDGLIMTMTASDPKWSYIRFDANGRASEVVEKQVVSNEATVGIYNYRRGRDFVAGARAMISKGRRVNGEFYVAPVYNELLADGMRVGYFNVGAEGAGMYGLGIPADLALFERSPVSQRAVEGSGGRSRV